MSKLTPRISLATGVALAVGMVVGSGMFGLPGLALQAAPPQTTALAWMIGASASVPLVWIFAILGSRYPSAGGLAHYAEVSLGPAGGRAVTAVLCGTLPIGIPALAMIGASYALPLLGANDDALLPIAALIVLLAVLLNLAGVRTSNAINGIALVLMTFAVGLLGLLDLPRTLTGVELWIHPDVSGVRIADVWRVSAMLFWAFIGWESLSFSLEEFRDPQRTIRWVYLLSFVVVAMLYAVLAAAANGAALAGLPVDRPEGIAALVPPGWRGAFCLVILVIILANANAWVFGTSRLFFAAGDGGLLPRIVGRVDAHGLPRNAIIATGVCFAGVLALVAVLHLKLSDLVMIVSQNFLVLYLLSLLFYWRVTSGTMRWVATPLALASSGFLLSGFDFAIVYPIALLVLGASIRRPGFSPRP